MMAASSIEIPTITQFTYSVKLSEASKGVRIDVHIYAANNQETAINEAITTYLNTKQKCEKEKIPVAAMELVK